MNETKKNLLSVVVPCFNEEACIDIFIDAVRDAALECDYEIVFVDDGSTDKTLGLIRKRSDADSRIRYVSLSRNFGKEAALLAGLRHANGDYVVTMDVDLQDPPSMLPEMLKGIREEGFDCVAARRTSREGEPVIRSWCARKFYCLMKKFSDVRMINGARDFRMMTRKVVESVLSVTEVNRFTKGIYEWVGFRTKWLEYKNVERAAGKTKWSFLKLVKYSIEGLLAFSTAPLQLASLLGIFSCVAAFLALIFIFVRALIFGDPVNGWPSLACIIVFCSGLQLFVLGILGSYLSKTYLEAKRRPVYIVMESK